MLSHLRFHRRATSNPASPLPDQPPPWGDTAAQHEHPRSPRDATPRPDARPRSPTTSQLPPMLPPIARVASTGFDHEFTLPDDPTPSSESRVATVRPPYDEDGHSGFIGGVALENYLRGAQGSRPPDSAVAVARQPLEPRLPRTKPPPPPIKTGLALRPTAAANKQTASSSLAMPASAQPGSGGTTGKRPAGTRLVVEPLSHAASGAAPEPQKGRKGLPFLKNPMSSLLMRRKAGQSAAETQPLAPSYDPRIRGTRVHDFSAPRPKKPISVTDAPTAAASAAAPTVGKSTDHGGFENSCPPTEPATTSSSANSVVPPQDATIRASETGPDLGKQEGRKLSLYRVFPAQPAPPVPPKDGARSSLRSSSSATTRNTPVAPLPLLGSALVKTTASPKISLSETPKRDSVGSAVPKHMKSTSSRFSFDMIGAAEQERLLEERHRQREQEKKVSDDSGYVDPKFDDYDEEFDYDAMMDDDGLEEKIPGINADYEDEEDLEAAMDPDNDQENFAGFVFQRSNPASSLASPHTPGMLATPRDADGHIIGFAVTKDATPDLPPSPFPMFPGHQALPKSDGIPSPGVQGLDAGAASTPQEPTHGPSYQPAAVSSQPAAPADNDDLYFDDGLADELDFENDGPAFDESIFDNNDTDQFGRPIPGAFARAQEAVRAAQQQQPSKRDSDMTSNLSAQSGITHSTAHTSFGLDEPASPLKHASTDAAAFADIVAKDLAYQAALAEAAQKAAASGKFRRSSSPETPSGLTDAPQTDSAEPRGYSPRATHPDDYEDDGFRDDFDDFDFDDEAIIAEANASALANDSDGFYGQEFGFYSAPIPHPPYSHGHGHQLSSSSSPSGVLSTENLFQYANGGYFGPAGAALNRSTSGRVVSREPNLTPITERSEYSNRNSVMSFTLPPAIGGGESRNSASLASPGLAQLALMSDDDNSMSLSALLKLRSRAWGGSQASLVSSREGSPRSELAVPAAAATAVGDGTASPYGVGSGTVPAHLTGHMRVGSNLSLWSLSEADSGGSGAASPTVNAAALPLPLPGGQMPGSAGAGAGSNRVVSPLPQPSNSLFLPPIPAPATSPGQQLGGSACSPVLEGEEAELEEGAAGPGGAGYALAPALPLRPRLSAQIQEEGGELEAEDGAGLLDETVSSQQPEEREEEGKEAEVPRQPGLGHRHRGSADSISYVKDEQGGGNRWVVERRRTSESGVVEILGRELVEGGRI